MDSTVLTCGPLRLTVPSIARTPSVTLKGAAVEINFTNFTGSVLFETIPCSSSKQSVHTDPVPSVLPSLSLDPLPSIPEPAQRKPTQLPAPATALNSTPTPPHSFPSIDSNFTSQPFSSAVSTFPLPTQTPIYTSSQYQPSQNFEPQLTQPFALSQTYPYASQPLLDFSQTPSSSQTDPVFPSQYNNLPQSQPSSEPDTTVQPLTQFQNFMPLTPPSSQDDSEDDIVLSPVPVRKPPPKPKTSAKRKNPPAFRQAVKTGKRVRFQEKVEQIEVVKPVDVVTLTEEKEIVNKDIAQHTTKKEGATKEVVEIPKPASLSPVTPPRRAKPSPWRSVELKEAPGRRWGCTFTRLANNTAVLLGGESELNGFFKQMALLDMKDMRWVQNGKDTPPMLGSGRAWHTTTAVDSNLFVFGGEMEINGERTQTNEALMYDTTYYTWYPPALSGPAPSARAGHCAALIPDSKNILLFGGINGNRWLSDLFLLEDLSVWSKVKISSKCIRPTARSYASLTPAAGFLVLFGGNNKTKCFNDVHLFTPKDLTWTEPIILGRCPCPRTGHSAIASKDGKTVIIYGGWDDQGKQRIFYSDVWELKIKSQTECQWSCLYAGDNGSKVPGPRAGAALCGAAGEGQKTYLFGGWHQLTYFNDVTELTFGEAPTA